jgi:hypothetical protein
MGLGVKVGYAFGNQGSAIPYLAAGFEFSSMDSKNASDENKSSGTDITLGAGVCLQAAKHAGITVEAGYHIQSMKPEGANESTSGNVIGIGIGVIGMIY